MELGKYFVEISMFVAEINDECLLGIDYLKKINLENIFDAVFNVPKFNKEKVLYYSRINDSSEKIPFILEELFENNSVNLEGVQ